jgi:hypothetical protein
MKEVQFWRTGPLLYSYIIENDDVVFVPALRTPNGYVVCAMEYEVSSRLIFI